jgi:hypothetical protein
MDDRLLLYRGGDQEDLSAINPDAIVWQQIQVSYIKEADRSFP